MKPKLTEITITPIKPSFGLIAFASLVVDENWYLGSIAIYSRLNGGYRLVYPTKKIGDKSLNIFHPINREIAEFVEAEVIKEYQRIIGS